MFIFHLTLSLSVIGSTDLFWFCSLTEEDGGEPYDPGCWRGKVQDWDGAGLVVEDESEFLTGQ